MPTLDDPDHGSTGDDVVAFLDLLGQQADSQQVDFSRRDLRHAPLQGRSLPGARLSGTNLSHARLMTADLADADLFGAILMQSDLRQANLTRAVLRGASLRGANLNDACIAEADFRGGVIVGPGSIGQVGLHPADLADCMAEYVTATRAQLSGVDLSGASLIGANLEGAVLFGANLTGANLSFANLRGANLGDTRIGGAHFIGADLTDAKLRNARADQTLFQAAIIDGAELTGLDRARCVFGDDRYLRPLSAFPIDIRRTIEAHDAWVRHRTRQGAPGTLADADLSHIDLGEKALSGMVFRRCRMIGARIDDTECVLTSFVDCDLLAASFAGANLYGTRFTGSNLRRSQFAEAWVGTVPLADASGNPSDRVQATDFTGVRLEGGELDPIDLASCIPP